MPALHSTHQKHTAIIIALGPEAAPGHPAPGELASLLRDLDYEVVSMVRQRRLATSAAPLGRGKIEEIKAVLAELPSASGPPLVVVCGLIEPGPLRHLQSALSVSVVDRTEIILRIFEARAKTPLVQAEVLRSRLLYSLPRLRDIDTSHRQGGGGGRAAKGNTQLVLNRQAIQKKIALLSRDIERLRIQNERATERRAETKAIALLGYTNAGKSSWMSALCRAQSDAKDQLFATLSTKVRPLAGAGTRVLVADTVGFLEGLPHEVLEAFYSTLREALHAHLLIHVADAQSPFLDRQISVTQEVLAHLGAGDRPTWLFLNKADTLDDQRRAELTLRYPEARLVSAHERDDVSQVTKEIRAFFEESAQKREQTEFLSEVRG